ncbi:uncharacterized protein MYCFIDRAFT_212474 [Pseudocercospora fijiensis CIRAD86]|uniref:Uncharacterized protein n=1 Tax=Pseudocercospora fijiensis (strain CIRAD86) TaxID=383855 RepID=M3ANU5_PSEFD|nr:uncharacterized protein MYCFIDRAFT_212474 [Pseudocercospora fijiensis CIRAD86]EME78773.1 hypothetical protein MYCFIDRAFT_212474 [Pseudocercospora fijiensis CIRAD86]
MQTSLNCIVPSDSNLNDLDDGLIEIEERFDFCIDHESNIRHSALCYNTEQKATACSEESTLNIPRGGETEEPRQAATAADEDLDRAVRSGDVQAHPRLSN